MRKKFTINFIFLLFTFCILHFTFYISSVSALDSTPSADIKIKLEELKKEIASKAAKIKQDINRKLKDKAYIGTIKQISSNSINLETQSSPRIVNINQDTVFENKINPKQKISLKKISEEDYIAALGDADETGVLTAKKIILLPTKNDQKPKTYLWGQVISISDQLATLKNGSSKSIAVSMSAAAGLKKICCSEIKINDFVILTGNQVKNDIFKASFVYVIPQGGIIKPKKMATASAQVASPSAKPKTTRR